MDILIGLLVFIALIFLAVRSIILWYFKIDEISNTLKQIEMNTRLTKDE